MSNKIALSFDVEEIYQIHALTQNPKTPFEYYQNKNAVDNITDSVNRLLEQLEKLDIKATFFIVANLIDHYPELVCNLRDSHHEIACHSLAHKPVIDAKNKKPTDSFKNILEELKIAKDIIEQTFGNQVLGYRAPEARIAPFMVSLLQEAGFKYDSSISNNSFYNKNSISVLHIPEEPYFISHQHLGCEADNSELVELPWATYTFLNMKIPVAGAFFYRLFGNNIFKHVLKSNLKECDTMFYMHPYEIARNGIPAAEKVNRPLINFRSGEKSYRSLTDLLSYFKISWAPCELVYKRFINK